MEDKIIDLEVALERLGGDKEFLLELFDELNDQMDPTISDLKTAIETADYDQLRSVAHGMKGASSNLGADKISSYFKELEEMGRNKSADGAKEIIGKIKQAHIEILDILKTI
ncbi:MAG: Hpt domain-containing protein [Calditrichaceae bacterium]|jgi:HPt (histidine-containing phosphotransfer) domain-containing protein